MKPRANPMTKTMAAVAFTLCLLAPGVHAVPPVVHTTCGPSPEYPGWSRCAATNNPNCTRQNYSLEITIPDPPSFRDCALLIRDSLTLGIIYRVAAPAWPATPPQSRHSGCDTRVLRDGELQSMMGILFSLGYLKRDYLCWPTSGQQLTSVTVTYDSDPFDCH
jgi:hypothetical protein